MNDTNNLLKFIYVFSRIFTYKLRLSMLLLYLYIFLMFIFVGPEKTN